MSHVNKSALTFDISVEGDEGEDEERGALEGSCAHDILGRKCPVHMSGKPPECLATEISLKHKCGDTYVVTFPKTGTTLLSFICHLLRSAQRTDTALTNFDDICQVVPHISSSWFIDQDINATQPGACRLFRSHRTLQQVGGWTCTPGIRYIATVRDPTATLLSLYAHREARGRFQGAVPSLLEYAQSPAWLHEHMVGCMPSIWEYYRDFWRSRYI